MNRLDRILVDHDDLIAMLPAPQVSLAKRQQPRQWRDSDAYWNAVNVACRDLAALYPEFVGPHGAVGFSRCVFDGGDVVYKVGCQQAQQCELQAFEQPESVDGLPVARCRMVYHATGVPILIMETVLPARPGDDIPDWACRVDSRQVGRDRNGDWVIFDAGNGVCDEDFDSSWSQSCSGTGFIDHPIPMIFAAQPRSA